MSRQHLLDRLLNVQTDTFEALALDIFRYQATHNRVYADFLALLKVNPLGVQQLADIPFLPIELFKSYAIQSGQWRAERVFTSSGTTGSATSRHLLRSELLYQVNARRAFELQYGPLSTYTILALLPAYLERSRSSLVFMVDDFIRQTQDPDSGFFLYDQAALLAAISRARARGRKILLLGVSFALLDLAEAHPGDYSGIIVMETGGMKGRRKELTRNELHDILQEAFQLETIHSEYGMTELLSQAYSPGRGRFY
ncbi:MAG: acyl transferase, partial [Bacteroidetes bacterium]